MSQIIEAIHISSGDPLRISLHGDEVARIEKITGELPELKRKQLPFFAPGLVDLQLNGFKGINMNELPLTVEDVCRMTQLNFTQGVTSYYPTVITNSSENIIQLVKVIDQACFSEELVDDCIPGIHLEGPFISPENGPRGAHSLSYVQQPDWDLFQVWQEAAGDRIRIISLSLEWDTAESFIKKCVEHSITVSIGHTHATGEQIKRAVAAGARLSTHLGNGAHLNLPRHPNYIWDQLAEDELWTSVIADGFHLPESVLSVFYKVKGTKMLIVSDAVHLAGQEPGKYHTLIGGDVVLLESGKLHMAENSSYLAGSAQMLPAGIEFMFHSGICDLAAAWEMASVRPAEFMNIPNLPHSILTGAFTDFVIFSLEQGRVAIKQVFKKNRKVWECNE
jgi:N-acetylglucosamine-6-phosphate deacetylase